MATSFKNSVENAIGTTPVKVLETTPLTRCTVIGLSLVNITGGNVSVNVLVVDDTSATGYYVKGVIIPPNSALRVVNQGEKLILAPENSLLVQSNTANSIDCIVSYVEIN
jgi:hypothetical protein